MKELIEALNIFAKYTDAAYPFHCEHDVLYVPVVDYDEVSDEDKARLEELGFEENTESDQGFMSFRYGSC